MKKNLLIALAVCLAAVAGVIAQPYHTIRVALPYPVVVGNITVPAGAAQITDMNDNGSSSLMIIRSDSGPSASILMSRIKDVKQSDAQKASVILRQTTTGYELQSLEIDGQEYGSLR